MKPSQHDFLEEYDPGDLEFMSEDPRGGQEIGGCANLLWARPYLLGPSRLPRLTSFTYISLCTVKTSNIKIDREFRRLKPL